jgi:hypothetical protein
VGLGKTVKYTTIMFINNNKHNQQRKQQRYSSLKTTKIFKFENNTTSWRIYIEPERTKIYISCDVEQNHIVKRNNKTILPSWKNQKHCIHSW